VPPDQPAQQNGKRAIKDRAKPCPGLHHLQMLGGHQHDHRHGPGHRVRRVRFPTVVRARAPLAEGGVGPVAASNQQECGCRGGFRSSGRRSGLGRKPGFRPCRNGAWIGWFARRAKQLRPNRGGGWPPEAGTGQPGARPPAGRRLSSRNGIAHQQLGLRFEPGNRATPYRQAPAEASAWVPGGKIGHRSPTTWQTRAATRARREAGLRPHRGDPIVSQRGQAGHPHRRRVRWR